jgi:GT2 family glycosyltransferase
MAASTGITIARVREWLAMLAADILRAPGEPAPIPAAHLPFLADADIEPIRPKIVRRHAPAIERAARPPSIDARADVAVVLGSYNRRVLLDRAIESVRENLRGLRGEIIVVDGGSEDGSVEWLVTQKDVITVIQHNRYEQDGLTRRRMTWGQFMNIGFRAASAERVIMISDDCYLLPGAIGSALKRMDEAERAGLKVGACAFYFRNWPHDDAYYVQRTLGGNLMVNHGVYTREALAAAGYCNEDDYAFYKADSDLSLSIWQAGYAIIDAPGSICEHFMSEAEAARIGNTATMDYDRDKLRERWGELIGKKSARKMGRKLLDWRDPAETAERVFGDQVEAERPVERAVSGAT